MIEFACPHCARKLKAKPSAAGKVTPCPECSQPLRVPVSPPTALGEPEGSLPEQAGRQGPGIAAQALDAVPESAAEEGKPHPTTVKPGDHAAISYPGLERDGAEPSGGGASAGGVDGEAEEEALKLLAPAQGPDEIGRLGPYRVLKVLGAGGMGVVFQAEDTQLKRLVALKAILPSRAENRDARQRFLLEAQAAAAVKDERIVTIHQVGEDRGIPFLAMEFLEGESLEARLGREGRFPVAEVLRIGREVAAGLAVAHAAGLIHRDIKPANIWLETKASETNPEFGIRNSERKGETVPCAPSEIRTPDSEVRVPRTAFQRVKILDFGLARVRSQENQLTRTGIIVGTPAYMSPEQARGKDVDARSDLFSLGCVLYSLCTGEVPFKGPDTLAVLLALTQETPDPPGLLNLDVPAALSDLVMRLLAKERDGRPGSAHAVVETIQGIERDLAASGGIGTDAGDLRAVLSALGHEEIKPASRGPNQSSTPAGEGSAVHGAAQPIVIKHIENARIQIVRGDVMRGLAREKPTPQPASRADSSSETFAVKPAVKRPARTLQADASLAPAAAETSADEPAHPAADEPPGRRSQTYVAAGILIPAVAFLLVAVFVSMNRNEPAPPVQVGSAGPVETAPARALPQLPRETVNSAAPLKPAVPVAQAPFDALRREGIDPYELMAAGGGAPGHAPPGLVAILGHSRLKHWTRVTSVAFSPDGQSLASASVDGTVTVWDAATGKLRRAWHGPAAGVNSVAFSPDGEVLAAGGANGAVLLWETATGKERPGVGGQKAVTALAFSPDGFVLALGAADGTLKLWETVGGRAQSLPGHRGTVTAVAFSPDGRLLASGSIDKTARLWEAATGKALRTLSGNRGEVTSVAFGHAGRSLATGNGDGTVRLWKLPAGEPLALLPAGPDKTPTRSVSFRPDGKVLAVGDLGGKVVLWDPAGRAPVRTWTAHHGPVASVVFCSDGKTLASGGQDGALIVWDPNSGKPLLPAEGNHGACRCVALSPDGTAVASGEEDGTVRIRHPGTGKLLHELHGHRGPVGATAFSPDGIVLASAGRDGTVRLWQAASGKEIATFAGRGPAVAAVAFSPDGRMLASGSLDGKARLWNPANGKEMGSALDHRVALRAVAFSPDGKALACAGNDGLVKLWQTTEGKELGEFPGLAADVRSVAFSADGELLAGGASDGTIVVWESKTGRQRNSLVGHRGGVNSLAFGANAGELASAGSDGSVRIWDLTDTAKGDVLQLGPAGGNVHQVVYSRDARYLLTANGNGTIYIFRQTPRPGANESPKSGAP